MNETWTASGPLPRERMTGDEVLTHLCQKAGVQLDLELLDLTLYGRVGLPFMFSCLKCGTERTFGHAVVVRGRALCEPCARTEPNNGPGGAA